MKIIRTDTSATYILIAGCVLWTVFSGADLLAPTVTEMIRQGANFTPLTFNGQPWRLVASLFLHFGFLHLLLNSLALLYLGRAIEPLTGSLTFVMLFLIAGITGSLASSYWNLFAVSMGASGALFGLFGFDLIITIRKYRRDYSEIFLLILSGGIYVALMLLIGELLPFDNAAHLGGLCAGILMGALYILPYPRHKSLMVLTGLFVAIAGYFLIPEYQVIHYQHFQTVIKEEKKITDQSLKFTNDAAALRGYKDIGKTYDSLSGLFRDSLGAIPESLREDRDNLAFQMHLKKRETDFKVQLLSEQSYRYLDSVEWVQRQPIPELHHPLALEEPTESEMALQPKVIRVWYDKNWKETENSFQAEYYRLGYQDSLNRWHGRVEDYYLNGGIQMKGYYNAGLRDGAFRYYSKDSTYTASGRYDNEIRSGKWEFFHENGRLSEIRSFSDKNYLLSAWTEQGDQQVENGNGTLIEYYSTGEIKSLISYSDGLANGRAYGNYADGRRKFEEIYKSGRLTMGRSYGDKSTNTYDMSTFYPFPAGGMEAFQEYVDERTSRAGLKEGSVQLLFTCPPSGEIYDIRIWKGYSPSHDSVAVSILENGPPWIPAREHGMDPYTSEGTVTITFKP